MKESKGNTVKFRLDGQLPAGMQPVKTGDRPIDYSDAPELSDAWFEQASRGGGAAASQETGQHAY